MESFRVSVELTVVGCGDAFGTDGRFQTCFSVSSPSETFLIDCGATSMTALRQASIEPNAISLIVCTHLHVDHFAGVPSFVVDAQVVSRREVPLTIVGPPGTRQRLEALMPQLFPTFSGVKRRFRMRVVELSPGAPLEVGPVNIRGYPVNHFGNDCGAPPLAVRIEFAGRILAYSGDTDWVDTLVDAGEGADLFIAEAWTRETKVQYHMDLPSLEANLDRICAKRTVLTHLGPEMFGPTALTSLMTLSDRMRIVL